MAKQKFYVVWSGKQTGLFTSWDECKKQVLGYTGSRYKSFPTEAEAKQAYEAGPSGQSSSKSKQNNPQESSKSPLITASKTVKYIEESICVDAACSGNPGLMEYQGVCTETGEQLFHFGPISNGTNNIGEFLAIVHALALLKKESNNMPIYSDSITAISWVRKKQVNTNIQKNKSTEKLWQVIDRALSWLDNNPYPNKILKWETKLWGEIKADFGRK